MEDLNTTTDISSGDSSPTSPDKEESTDHLNILIKSYETREKVLLYRLFQKDLACHGCEHFLKKLESILWQRMVMIGKKKREKKEQQQQQSSSTTNSKERQERIQRKAPDSASLVVGTAATTTSSSSNSSNSLSTYNYSSWWRPSTPNPTASSSTGPIPPPPPPPPPPAFGSLSNSLNYQDFYREALKSFKEQMIIDNNNNNNNEDSALNFLPFVRWALSLLAFAERMDIPFLPASTGQSAEAEAMQSNLSEWKEPGDEGEEQQSLALDPEALEQKILKILNELASAEEEKETERGASITLLKNLLSQVFKSSSMLRKEIEDLTATLFQQSNTFVHESMLNTHRLQKENEKLRITLEETRKTLSRTEHEMKRIRRKLAKGNVLSIVLGEDSANAVVNSGLESLSVRSSTVNKLSPHQSNANNNNNNNESTNINNNNDDAESSVLSPSLLFVDKNSLFEFQELILFVHTNNAKFSLSLSSPNANSNSSPMMTSPGYSPAVPSTASPASNSNLFLSGGGSMPELSPFICQSSWYKRIFLEEIDPLFSSLPVLSARTNATSLIKKKIIELFLKGSISLEERIETTTIAAASTSASTNVSPLSSVSGSNFIGPLRMKCPFCLTNKECHYRIFIANNASAPSSDSNANINSSPLSIINGNNACIDRFCYEKLAALLNFFITLQRIVFISVNGNSADSTPLLELFRWSLLARRGLVKVRVVGMSELENSIADISVSERLHILS